MRLNAKALKAAAEAAHGHRYLSHSVSDEQLARLVLTAYKEAIPRRPPSSKAVEAAQKAKERLE